MSDQHESRLDAAISRGFDPHQSYELTPSERAEVDAARAAGRDLLQEFADAVRDAQARAEQPDPQIERELQHELAERDREWWS